MAKLADLPSKLKLWEPEESVGLLWDAVVDRDDGRSPHHDAGVTLEEMSSRLAVLFRGLSDGLAVEIKEAFKTDRRDRRSPAARASFDGETLRLPALIDWSPRRDLNEGFYLWLTAACALSEAPTLLPADPLQADLVTLRRCRGLTAAALEACPGLVDLYQGLAAACLTIRPASGL
ncbi:MAG: protein norD, partial [Kiloniellales bacterium]|nr:protein norD [Kiloniellales bacterium]